MTKLKDKKGQVAPRETRDLHPLDEMDRLFDRLTGGGFLRPFDWRFPELKDFRFMETGMPRVDLIDREDHILVRAEIPGVKKDDLDLSITRELLTIKGETRMEHEESGEWFHSEIRRGSFSRTLRLPNEVMPDKAEARFEDGMLEITIPKAREAKRHTIKLT